MIVVFRRTGQRRYAVEARREDFPDLVMDPAPGYDQLMPHDLMHLVVEAQLGLTRAIYGQLAAGGTAGTFHLLVKSDESSRELKRAGKRVRARGEKLLKKGQDDCARSERATYICWQEWLARSSSGDRKERAHTMAKQAAQLKGVATEGELRTLNPRKLNEICEHLDQLSIEWSSLKVGETMAVRWPDLGIVNR